jgi:hypothetical protein
MFLSVSLKLFHDKQFFGPTAHFKIFKFEIKMIRKENAKIFYVQHITNTKVTHFLCSEFKFNCMSDTTYKKKM